MCKDGYNLDYLSIEYNIDEAEKRIADVFDRLKVLNLENSSLELKTISSYFDGIYNDFDKEKMARNKFNELGRSIVIKTKKLEEIANNLSSKLDNIKAHYEIKDNDIRDLNLASVTIKGIEEDYDMIVSSARAKSFAYSRLTKEMEKINIRVLKVEENLDAILKEFNGYKEDEKRARDQLEEIKAILRAAKEKINTYKLPVVPKTYYVELSEATESINDMVKALKDKPLNIENLNTRVDTARDLTLKLYRTTNETVKTASMSEHAIVYGNRYRSSNKYVDDMLGKAEKLFYSGCFKASLEDALSAINRVEPGIQQKLLNDLKPNKE